MRNNRGFTLAELIVVLSVVVILAFALGFFYQNWMGRYKVESAVKQLFEDLMTARTRAMQTNISYVADFPTATQYRISTWNDANGNGAIDAGETTVLNSTFPKTLQYSMSSSPAGLMPLTFDKRGLIYSGATPLLIDPAANPPTVTISLADANIFPDYDCIVMSQSRINIGLMTPPGAGGVCNAK